MSGKKKETGAESHPALKKNLKRPSPPQAPAGGGTAPKMTKNLRRPPPTPPSHPPGRTSGPKPRKWALWALAVLVVAAGYWLITGGARNFIFSRAFSHIEDGTQAILNIEKDEALDQFEAARKYLDLADAEKMARSVHEMHECLFVMRKAPSDAPHKLLGHEGFRPLFYREERAYAYGFFGHREGLIYFQVQRPSDGQSAAPVVEEWGGTYFVYWKRARASDCRMLYGIVSTKETAEKIADMGRKRPGSVHTARKIDRMEEFRYKVRKIDFNPPWR